MQDQTIFHTQLIQKQLQGLYKQSLYLTAKKLLGYKDTNVRTHGEMIRALEADTCRKLIVMPRGCFKSSIGSVAFPIWLLMRNPNERILIDSEVYTNSKNFLREIKAHLQSESFISVFGDWRSESNWTEGEITISTRTQNYKEASITCGGIETVKVGQHYSTIIGDDLNSSNNSRSQDSLQKVIDHYRMNQAILEPGGIYCVIGTRYHANDVIGFIVDNEIGVKPETLGLMSQH